MVSASAFFFSSAWPRVAPTSRALITASTVTVGTTTSRFAILRGQRREGATEGWVRARRAPKKSPPPRREVVVGGGPQSAPAATAGARQPPAARAPGLPPREGEFSTTSRGNGNAGSSSPHCLLSSGLRALEKAPALLAV